MKNIIVACGSGIATSTILNSKLTDLLIENRIQHNLIQCSVNEIDSYLAEADLIVSSMQLMKEYPIPKVSGMPYLTGINEEELNLLIIKLLSNNKEG